jgi:2-polyprenyl-6-methoxyphenol hydroxylase-like FAD-dependent oxidoreductase
MMLAAELALARVDVAVIERRPDQEVDGSRAGGLHSRAIELLDQRGVAGRFLAEGQPVQIASFGETKLDLSDFPTRHPYGLALWQTHIERLMGEWVTELGVPVHYGQVVSGIAQDEERVEVELAGGGALRAEYLVGCDGGRSLVRKAVGIDFPGWEATRSTLVAEVRMSPQPEFGIHRTALGIGGIGPTADGGGTVRAVVPEGRLEQGDEPSLDELRDALFAFYGTDHGVHRPSWISRFTDATRQAAEYRRGRVLIAGDAVHIHSPMGGQGIPLGMQDAVNLGWKLAQVVKGTSPEALLDTYQAERHSPTARSLRYTMAQNALSRVDPRTEALRDTIAEVTVMDEPRRHLAAMIAGLDVRYDLGDGHPLLGRRVPDLDLATAEGPARVYSLLHEARPVLLNFGEPGLLDLGPWSDRVRAVDARCDAPWELPALGEVPAPAAVLVRPDGHVAWVGDGTAAGLADALTTWFGPPAPAERAWHPSVSAASGGPDRPFVAGEQVVDDEALLAGLGESGPGVFLQLQQASQGVVQDRHRFLGAALVGPEAVLADDRVVPGVEGAAVDRGAEGEDAGFHHIRVQDLLQGGRHRGVLLVPCLQPLDRGVDLFQRAAHRLFAHLLDEAKGRQLPHVVGEPAHVDPRLLGDVGCRAVPLGRVHRVEDPHSQGV